MLVPPGAIWIIDRVAGRVPLSSLGRPSGEASDWTCLLRRRLLLPEKQGVPNRDSSKAEQTYSVPWPFPLCVVPTPAALIKRPRVHDGWENPNRGAYLASPSHDRAGVPQRFSPLLLPHSRRPVGRLGPRARAWSAKFCYRFPLALPVGCPSAAWAFRSARRGLNCRDSAWQPTLS